jgi:hypothetical protein
VCVLSGLCQFKIAEILDFIEGLAVRAKQVEVCPQDNSYNNLQSDSGLEFTDAAGQM